MAIKQEAWFTGSGTCTGPEKTRPLSIPVRRLTLTPTGATVWCDQRTSDGRCGAKAPRRPTCLFDAIPQAEINALDTTRTINTVLGEIVYDPNRHVVSNWPRKKDSDPAEQTLTPILNGLLNALTATPDTLVTHDSLIEAMWPDGNIPGQAQEVQIPKRILQLKALLNLNDITIGDETIKIIESIREVSPHAGGYRLNTGEHRITI